jgi:hypothetical protein
MLNWNNVLVNWIRCAIHIIPEEFSLQTSRFYLFLRGKKGGEEGEGGEGRRRRRARGREGKKNNNLENN